MKKFLLSLYKPMRYIFRLLKINEFRFISDLNIKFLGVLKSKYSIVQGHKMILDENDSLFLSINGVYEKSETETIKKIIKPGDTVIDIGANIGYYTLIFAKLVGNKGKVIAFEPEPTNYSILKKNIKMNGYQNIQVVKKAVTDKTEKLTLYLNDKNKGDHRIYNSGDRRKHVQISGIKLDDYFKSIVKVDFIKMDIQGSEIRALKGMKNILKQNKSMYILTEFWPFGLKKAGSNPKDLLNILKKNNFEIYEIDNKNGKLKMIKIPEFIKNYPLRRKRDTNLLCKR